MGLDKMVTILPFCPPEGLISAPNFLVGPARASNWARDPGPATRPGPGRGGGRGGGGAPSRAGRPGRGPGPNLRPGPAQRNSLGPNSGLRVDKIGELAQLCPDPFKTVLDIIAQYVPSHPKPPMDIIMQNAPKCPPDVGFFKCIFL